MHMRRSGLSHFSKRVVDVAFVKLVIPADVNHRAVKGLVGPFHTSRLDVRVNGLHDDVSVCFRWFEGGKAVEQQTNIFMTLPRRACWQPRSTIKRYIGSH